MRYLVALINWSSLIYYCYKERNEMMMHVNIVRCTPWIGALTAKRWHLVGRIGSSSFG